MQAKLRKYRKEIRERQLEEYMKEVRHFHLANNEAAFLLEQQKGTELDLELARMEEMLQELEGSSQVRRDRGEQEEGLEGERASDWTPDHESFLTSMLEVGLHLHHTLDSTRREEAFWLISDMLRIIIDCRLYLHPAHHPLITQICEEAVLSETLNPILEIWALTLLEKVGVEKEESFKKLRIHYTFSLRNSQNDQMTTMFLEFVQNALEEPLPYLL